MMGQLLTTSQVAELLNVEPQTVRRMAVSGSIPCIKLGDGVRPHYRFDRTTLLEWVKSHHEISKR